MRRPIALLPRGERRIAAEALVGSAAVLALLARVHGMAGLSLAGLSLVLAASLLLGVQAPRGSVPLGYALIIALSELRGLLRKEVVVNPELLVGQRQSGHVDLIGVFGM